MRAARRLIPVAVLVGALALGAGCGGDDSGGALSADDYRAQLNDACNTLFGGIQELSQTASDQDLDTAEIQQRADELSADFESTVGDLNPPDELTDAHQEMVDLGDQVPADDAEFDEFVDYQRRNLEAFDALGAEDCVAAERNAIDQMDGG